MVRGVLRQHLGKSHLTLLHYVTTATRLSHRFGAMMTKARPCAMRRHTTFSQFLNAVYHVHLYLSTRSCGLYFKLHGSARPTSMKSDVNCKRSRHDACHGSGHGSETSSASQGASRCPSPNEDADVVFCPRSRSIPTQARLRM